MRVRHSIKLKKRKMSRLQTIENALASINETVFQELCDSKGVNTKSTKYIYNNYLNNSYLLRKRKKTKSTIA